MTVIAMDPAMTVIVFPEAISFVDKIKRQSLCL